MDIAVIGSGVAGLSAAWLLSHNHKVDLFEKDDRLGGHANTQQIELNGAPVAVDTGFIVYNEHTYPNLTALFDHIGVETADSDMSFSVSLANGKQEYSGTGLRGLFAKPSNMLNPRFLKMLADIRRFYAEATEEFAANPDLDVTLGAYLSEKGYSEVFIREHLMPMGAAIWSVPSEQMLKFPFSAFMRFCVNHGLVQFRDRPQWRTVPSGSRAYVDRLAAGISGEIHLNAAIAEIDRRPGSVTLYTRHGTEKRYDHVVLACHSDQALRILSSGNGEASAEEQALLSAIPYQRNLAILHTDSRLMPRRKAAWASWNYLQQSDKSGQGEEAQLSVTYWMNNLQPLDTEEDLFVTLNPITPPAEGSILRSSIYHHPVYSLEAMEAQKHLWTLQGKKRTWFCGAYFGYGFHEDGLQSGLAVAEQLGGMARPWQVDNPSGRIHLSESGLDRLAPFTPQARKAAAE
ncbi:NAD(P)/FAD-dependent oxidoreductase [Cohaesibacter intestini]|uniref:NAD(P)/FAD-dependent oxidoreductase n=1 Tax=Cohaesibacter intestini TaxID=2211145 RepID=UPI000DEA54F7|nr:NAD(P)/FAD-dependent oxidoreductase [Cohaesibacter intestini]